MELLELLKKRRSHRRFLNRTVEKNVIERVMEGVLTAPSSKNSRSSRFMIVADRELLGQLSLMRSSGSALLKDAPMAIVVMGDSSLTDLWVDNCAISATLMQLCVEAEGLGSCWVHVNGRPHNNDNPEGESAEDYVKTILPIPQNYRTLCIVAIGYPADQIPEHKPQNDSDKIINLK